MHTPGEVANPLRWAGYSIGVNVVLIGLNLFVALASGSLAIGAEVVHNGVDLISALAVLVGIKLATHSSRRFPYGLHKLENILAVGVAGMIFLTAYEIVRQALFGSHGPTVANLWMFPVLAASAAIPAVFSYFELRVGRKTGSPALIADAKEFQAHVWTTGIAMAALAGESFDLPLDRVAAGIIVIPVAKTGWDLLVDGIRVLLDVSLDPTTLDTIRETALAHPMVVDVASVTGRRAGRYRFVDVTLVLRGNNLTKADKVAHRIERQIREAVPRVERVLIHVDPKPPGTFRYAVPLADHQGTVADHFGNAPFFAFATMPSDDGEFESIEILRNPYRTTDRAKGIRVAEWLVEHKTDIVVVRVHLDKKGPAYVLENAGVSIERTDMTTLDEALRGAVSPRD